MAWEQFLQIRGGAWMAWGWASLLAAQEVCSSNPATYIILSSWNSNLSKNGVLWSKWRIRRRICRRGCVKIRLKRICMPWSRRQGPNMFWIKKWMERKRKKKCCLYSVSWENVSDKQINKRCSSSIGLGFLIPCSSPFAFQAK